MTPAGPDDTRGPHDGDDALLADLRRVLDAVDAPPADLAARGRDAFALRRLDDEFAELVADSSTDATATRDAVGLERMVSFAAGATSVDVQLTTRPDGAVELLGEIDPAPAGARVVVEGLEAAELAATEADPGGRFTLVVTSARAVRIRVLRRAGPAVVTPWFAL